jgi:uncharacterized protein with HEPN domain
MREAAWALIDHVAGQTRESFETERKTRSAVLFEIVVLGEGVKRLSLDLRSRYPAVPWGRISGMRDRLVHSFDQVDFDLVWNVTQIHVSSLLNELDQIIAQETPP